MTEFCGPFLSFFRKLLPETGPWDSLTNSLRAHPLAESLILRWHNGWTTLGSQLSPTSDGQGLSERPLREAVAVIWRGGRSFIVASVALAAVLIYATGYRHRRPVLVHAENSLFLHLLPDLPLLTGGPDQI
jgi:hypothetical protein